ncbi:MAG: sodium:calcium antiporter [Mariprofundaceae bacterium]
MIEALLSLVVALFVVFVAAQVFVNALEVMGEKMGVSEGVTGSIFAAVGTAMPETIIPIVAIVAGGAAEVVNHQIGLGAILGAPFMLGTLSIGLVAVAAGLKRGWHVTLVPEETGFKRDIKVFFMAYGLVILAALMPKDWEYGNVLISAVLIMLYFFYLLRTILASEKLVAEGHGTESEHGLYVERVFGDSQLVVFAQLIVGLLLLVWGAMLFVHGVEATSQLLGVSALVISLLIVPVATEMPEKINSILWIRKGKDTLAFGNVTGAMVFQGTVIPAVGMLLMPWVFDDVYASIAVLLALAGSGLMWVLHMSGRLTPAYLSIGNLLYGLFIVCILIL